jgi:hypothetical protein
MLNNQAKCFEFLRLAFNTCGVYGSAPLARQLCDQGAASRFSTKEARPPPGSAERWLDRSPARVVLPQARTRGGSVATSERFSMEITGDRDPRHSLEWTRFASAKVPAALWRASHFMTTRATNGMSQERAKTAPARFAKGVAPPPVVATGWRLRRTRTGKLSLPADSRTCSSNVCRPNRSFALSAPIRELSPPARMQISSGRCSRLVSVTLAFWRGRMGSQVPK